ncbi:sulfite exporter TauE/SafE family protein [Verrucomicrobiota bacterium]
MNASLFALTCTAAAIGFIHTIAGPDHYLPFAALASARKWSPFKTLRITLLCGLGHVLSSVVLGLIGLVAGVALKKLVHIEGFRGDVAAWLLTAFGVVYFVWGMVQAFRNRKHVHAHEHANGTCHAHLHNHQGEHMHPHTSSAKSMTPWALFVIFVFGPCEPLIPLLMYPAVNEAWWGVGVVALVFGAVTLATMCAMVMVVLFGFKSLKARGLSRFSHAAAGGAVLACGVAVLCGL